MLDKVVHVRVTQEEYDSLRNICDAEGVTVSTLMRQSIRYMTIPDTIGEWE